MQPAIFVIWLILSLTGIIFYAKRCNYCARQLNYYATPLNYCATPSTYTEMLLHDAEFWLRRKEMNPGSTKMLPNYTETSLSYTEMPLRDAACKLHYTSLSSNVTFFRLLVVPTPCVPKAADVSSHHTLIFFINQLKIYLC